MAFRDVELPEEISAGSEGGPGVLVQISRSVAGYEQRVVKRRSLRIFDLRYTIRGIDDLNVVYEHWLVMGGPEHTFPHTDRFDHRSCGPLETPAQDDQSIGTGDDSTAAFQLTKTYTRDAFTLVQDVTLPKNGTVLIAVAGVLKTETTHYTIDYETGIVTFTGGNIPTAGQAITAGYKYRVKVRFDLQDFSHVFQNFKFGNLPSIPLIEVRG